VELRNLLSSTLLSFISFDISFFSWLALPTSLTFAERNMEGYEFKTSRWHGWAFTLVAILWMEAIMSSLTDCLSCWKRWCGI